MHIVIVHVCRLLTAHYTLEYIQHHFSRRFSTPEKNNMALAAIAQVYLPISTVKIPPSLQASI